MLTFNVKQSLETQYTCQRGSCWLYLFIQKYVYRKRQVWSPDEDLMVETCCPFKDVATVIKTFQYFLPRFLILFLFGCLDCLWFLKTWSFLWIFWQSISFKYCRESWYKTKKPHHTSNSLKMTKLRDLQLSRKLLTFSIDCDLNTNKWACLAEL